MAKKHTKRSELWKKICFRYKLSFVNENTLEEVFALRISRLSGFLAFAVVAFLLIALTSIVIIKTPIRNYLPGYMDNEIRQLVTEYALRADSLEEVLSKQSLYLKNIGGVLRGDLQIDSVQKIDSLKEKIEPELEKTKLTEKFVRKFEEEEKYNLGVLNSSVSIPDNILFYRPVRGVISSHFSSREKHYGTDIAASPNESILSTLKGTVFFAGFDVNAGYMIQIQHKNGFISVYKHCAKILKNTGDEVNAGEVIALVGNTGQLTTGPHLHFELWYKGSPVDPEEFIAF